MTACGSVRAPMCIGQYCMLGVLANTSRALCVLARYAKTARGEHIHVHSDIVCKCCKPYLRVRAMLVLCNGTVYTLTHKMPLRTASLSSVISECTLLAQKQYKQSLTCFIILFFSMFFKTAYHGHQCKNCEMFTPYLNIEMCAGSNVKL